MAGGLGLAQFLKHGSESSSGGAWLKRWNKDGVGQITVWLHTRAPIVPCFSHTFMIEDEYEDKETGRMQPVLRYPRFISPDAEIVHKSQYFRNDDGTLQVPPDRDPFLLLREWLRTADNIGLEDPIFRWNDEKNRRQIVWVRGELSGQVKRGKLNFGHTLDTKHEYIYVVVDNDNISNGPVLTREGKLLSQKLIEVISHQRQECGEKEGDPLQHPYAFKWIAEKTPSPMNAYKCYKAERAEFTDEVWEHIGSQEFPDPVPHGTPSEGDPEKIRDAFAAAMQVDLPLDQIFSEDPEERRALVRGDGGKRAAPRPSKAAQARAAAQQPPPPTRTPAAGATAQAAEKPATSAGTKPAPQQRRKKVDKPAEPPPVETLPCEDCKAPMLVTDTKCAGCGAEYEVETEPEAPQPPATASATKPSTAGPKPGGATAAKAATSAKPSTAGPKPGSTAGPKPGAKPAAVSASPPQQGELPITAGDAEQSSEDCWSCGVFLEGKSVCPSCGIDQGDDIPF